MERRLSSASAILESTLPPKAEVGLKQTLADPERRRGNGGHISAASTPGHGSFLVISRPLRQIPQSDPARFVR